MEAAERTISKILTEQIRYEIPPYQRPYSWEKGNVEQLLDDVWDAFEADDEEYFIGSLITIERSKDELYDVVDGQQRLTTLNLIFARLRDAVSEPAKSTLGKRVLPKNELTGEEETPRLTLRQKDQSFFRRHVLASEEITDAISREIQNKQDAPKIRLTENLGVIDNFLAQRDEKSLKLFANYLLTKVYVVFVTTASWQSAYRLFNVLNARGMPLSNADLIKNMLFARMGGASSKSEELDEQWLQLEEAIGIERLDQFLAHHRSSVTAIKARKTLHEEYKPLIEASDSPFSFLDGITTSARNYLRIQQNGFEDVAARRSLRSLHRVAFEEWVPPLLAYLNNPVEGISEAEFIDLLEKVTYQNWIRRLAFTARLTAYFQLITAIRSGKSADEIRSIFRQNAQNEEFHSLLNGEVYGKPFAQAVLLRLEEADQDESVTKDYGGKITIEHVLPQALKEDYWRERFTDDAHRQWLHRLGNLALLAGIKNYKAQYFSFDRKKKIYSERNNKVSFDTTKLILEQDDWRPEFIEFRQAKMVEAAADIWTIA
ncbi:DUF262 domain-containing HNH endonuclease family protein [Aestuariivita sp.]|jgi:hypothetical protein|uniref:DUF262 domain-containing protein n=1 Tax=Aestuariivita sp. TaxID=1872407 RepID=UPI00216DE337|nr:DUF262 domain-containing HNH endonuclease family protein [Aestuariivita sp.]MCE8006406.1 DUF262 domain-containing protein [Aestuariivita sp.]